MTDAITFKNVSFGYQDSLVLEHIDLEVKEGEFIGIFGPNGGGKTTLLKLIMGFLEPNQGEVLIFGKEPEKSTPLISYVPQRLAFDKQFPISVLELVLEGKLHELPWYGRYSKDDLEKAIALLEKLGLKDQMSQQFGTLSGGQVQRALFTRALLSDPKILLLDEPTAGVDAEAENDIYQLLSELKGEITILMVTHQLKATIHHVDRALCVQREVSVLDTKQLCEHFAMGLYHPPLTKETP